MRVEDMGDKWPVVYANCLRNYKLLHAAKIARFYRPAKLYKYFSFDQYWEENLMNYQIVMSAPSQFNDPLDSRWFLDYDKILTERFKEIGQDWHEMELGKPENFSNMIALYEEDLMHLHDLFFVSCFSTTPFSNPMWGHYAAKHTGFCVEYATSKLPAKLSIIMPVIYDHRPYDASMLLDMRGIDDQFAQLCPILFKSTDWSYEKEWRICVPSNNADKPIIIKAEKSITGIYMGLHSYGKEQRNKIESWAKNENIPVFQMERSYKSYALTCDCLDDLYSGKKPRGFLV